MIFGRKNPDISIELKIIGFMGGEYVNIIGRVSVPDESPLSVLLKRARAGGMVPDALSRRLRSLPPEISVLVNGDPLPPRSRSAARLRDGDSVSFFAASSGG